MICSLTNPLFSDENTNSSNIVTVECSYNEIKKNYELPLEIITFSECACRSIWQDFEIEVYSCKQEMLSSLPSFRIMNDIPMTYRLR